MSRGHDHVAALLIALGANLEAENKVGYNLFYSNLRNMFSPWKKNKDILRV